MIAATIRAAPNMMRIIVVILTMTFADNEKDALHTKPTPAADKESVIVITRVRLRVAHTPLPAALDRTLHPRNTPRQSSITA
jgi:hypothetical protein